MDKTKMILDCDTGHDDAIALMVAYAHPALDLLGVTVVAGNQTLDKTLPNTLHVCQHLDLNVPVYGGCDRPMVRDQIVAGDVHGKSGLDGPVFAELTRTPEKKHAVQFLIDTLMNSDGDITLVPTGPLTNIAMAMRLEPRITKKICRISLMGGAVNLGNTTPAAEFNVYVDAEAAKIVLDSGMNSVWVTWDVCRGDCEITPADIDYLHSLRSRVADFCVRCTECLKKYEMKKYGNGSYGVIDSILMTSVIYPEVMGPVYEAYCDIETKAEMTYGYFSIDKQHQLHREPNASICTKVNADLYKKRLFQLFA